MKTINIDFDLYENERKELERKTWNRAMVFARSLLWISCQSDFNEHYNNAIHEDDKATMDFLEECYPGYHIAWKKKVELDNKDEEEKARKIFFGTSKFTEDDIPF